MRLAARWPVGFVDQTATCIRVHERNMSADPSYMERAMLAGVRHALADPVIAQRARGRERVHPGVHVRHDRAERLCQSPPRAKLAVAGRGPLASVAAAAARRALLGRAGRVLLGPDLRR